MKKILFAAALALSLLSCRENKPIIENAVDNTDSKISSSRYIKGQNMLDAIYYEQIKNDESLKKLDEKIVILQEDSRKVKNLYQDILRKNDEYYSDAEYAANSINDSALKKNISNLVKESSDQYNVNTQKLKELSLKITKNSQNIYGYYMAFKIRKTLPEIEKYQKAHPLKTDSLEQFINKQNQLLEELKKLK
ncbi:hypothetical protein BBH99_20415 [Chryseobacterium contaminans]|uniref:Cell-wall binding lipoprotein n=1 Tax=Chryseobacterium contaminans TaxID=1423959 RepID=A0A1M7CDX8_9FLAO|nr:hypothetical protein [Chryseobacterium contaminans]OCA78848.1 hypothetical protein BBH99_20415 [Chryseobacterium contaminans]SHL65464.1 hypothetical protein SAMN05444407_105185 [Chryseobacterium contaminans]